MNTLVSAQTNLDDWQRGAFNMWYVKYKWLTWILLVLAPISGTGLDAFVLLGSYIAKPLSAPWDQNLYSKLLLYSVIINLALQSIPQVCFLVPKHA